MTKWLSKTIDFLLGREDDWTAAIGKEVLYLYGTWTNHGYIFTDSMCCKGIVEDVIPNKAVKIYKAWIRVEALRLVGIV